MTTKNSVYYVCNSIIIISRNLFGFCLNLCDNNKTACVTEICHQLTSFMNVRKCVTYSLSSQYFITFHTGTNAIVQKPRLYTSSLFKPTVYSINTS